MDTQKNIWLPSAHRGVRIANTCFSVFPTILVLFTKEKCHPQPPEFFFFLWIQDPHATCSVYKLMIFLPQPPKCKNYRHVVTKYSLPVTSFPPTPHTTYTFQNSMNSIRIFLPPREKTNWSTIVFLRNALCLCLNLKCMSRVKIRHGKCYDLRTLVCCSNTMFKCES